MEYGKEFDQDRIIDTGLKRRSQKIPPDLLNPASDLPFGVSTSLYQRPSVPMDLEKHDGLSIVPVPGPSINERTGPHHNAIAGCRHQDKSDLSGFTHRSSVLLGNPSVHRNIPAAGL